MLTWVTRIRETESQLGGLELQIVNMFIHIYYTSLLPTLWLSAR
uniref:Uncharacterized protein n=1 Tax=Brassica campestris TaxID=3711 RepID=A0A3P5ZEF6_BRACM|nr:unnamed protein product [Brassica rapa]